MAIEKLGNEGESPPAFGKIGMFIDHDRIPLTCYLALVIYQYMEKKLGGNFTCNQIISTLQDMSVREVLGEGYLPNLMRTDITDALHEAFGFRPDYDIISSMQMKKIVKKSKTRI